MSIQTEYKGETIIFLEHADAWSWKNSTNISLSKIKESIDRAIKVEFKRKTAICKSRQKGFVVRTVTSKVEGKDEFWTVSESGTRHKENADSLYADTPENHVKISNIKNAEKEIQEIKTLIKDTLESMQPFKV